MRITGVFVGAMWIAGAAASVASADDAGAVYEKNCKACHGVDGAGNEKLKTKSFAEALKGQSDENIAKVIREGGKAVGKSPMMAAYGSKLNDGQIQALVQYIKGLGSK